MTTPGSASEAAEPFHLVVWLDHKLARLLALTRDAAQERLIHNGETGLGHIHHHAGSPGPGHVPLEQDFLEKISDAIGSAREIVIVGPGEAKMALKAFLDGHKPRQARKIVAVEPMDHATAAEIAAFARRIFVRVDRVIPPGNRG